MLKEDIEYVENFFAGHGNLVMAGMCFNRIKTALVEGQKPPTNHARDEICPQSDAIVSAYNNLPFKTGISPNG